MRVGLQPIYWTLVVPTKAKRPKGRRLRSSC